MQNQQLKASFWHWHTLINAVNTTILTAKFHSVSAETQKKTLLGQQVVNMCMAIIAYNFFKKNTNNTSDFWAIIPQTCPQLATFANTTVLLLFREISPPFQGTVSPLLHQSSFQCKAIVEQYRKRTS